MRIKEVADGVGFDRVTIRKWEKEGLIPQVNRSANGRRDYDVVDLLAIQKVIREKSQGKK
jgi:DNA-binding transcriptional MerR regulator